MPWFSTFLQSFLTTNFVAYLAQWQPSFYFPKPTGSYAVGTHEYHWIDTARRDILSDNTHHPYRELMVKIWYPTSPRLRRTGPTSLKLQNNFSEKPTTAYAPYLVNYFKKHDRLAWLAMFSRPLYSYAQAGVPLASGEQKFPILLFSHGFGCTPDMYTAQCEELASHGYIVVGIHHTYASAVVPFSDGRIVDVSVLLNKFNAAAQNGLELWKLMNEGIEIWTADVCFVLDQLERLARDKNSMFFDRLDQNNIGIFGHSMGGGVALQMCRRDARVKAAVDFDGGVVGADALQPFNKPCMFMLAGNNVKEWERPWTSEDYKKWGVHSLEEELQYKKYMLPAIRQLSQAIGHDVYTFVLNDVGHADFTDQTIYKCASPMLRFFARKDKTGVNLGTLNGLKVIEAINTYLLAFFNKYLKATRTRYKY